MHYNKFQVELGQFFDVHRKKKVFHTFSCDFIISGCIDSGV